ncbi:DUF5667 domain-containing protein [Streptomyces polyrhachis]|uniref:DUF5667 domain-containing protein n=1 Tax=Streptomyces polyrhachis TaxID=1282885 RepID=A0ABW2GMT3_9ACTN
MIGSVSAQANAFAQALEEPLPPEALQADPGQAQLLALAGGLAALPAPALSTEVRTEQRAMLVAAMERMFASGEAAAGAVPTASTASTVPEQRRRGAHRASRGPLAGLSRLRPRSRLSRGVAIGGLGVGVAAGALSGAAAASTDSLPGDTLYGLKRGMEDFRLSLAEGDSERGRVYLDQASTRLQEARRLMERGRAGDLDEESVAEVRRALTGVKHDAGEGHRLLHEAYESDGRLGPIQTLSNFSARHRGGWSELRTLLPQQLSDVSADVSQIFDAIDSDVAPLKDILPTQDPASESPDATATDPSGTVPGAPAPSTSPSPGGTGTESASPSPSASAGEDTPTDDGGGILGGLGGDAPATSDSPSSSPSASQSPQADITLPPLLPGLLPGLGIGEEE